MTSENTKNDTNNPEPFFIWKNARKEIKKLERRRKQSYQYPASEKKHRKMTIEVSRQASEFEDLPSFQSLSPDRGTKKEHTSLEHNAFIDSISEEEDNNLNGLIGKFDGEKEEEQIKDIHRLHEQHREYHVNNEHQEQGIEIEGNIPFACDEWELDKESPFMKNLNTMHNEMDELRLDV